MLDILLIIINIFLIFYCFYNLNIILLLYLYNTLILTIYYIKKYTLINKNINFIQKINIYLSITILFLLLIYIYYSK
jgi:hypothetical protein